MRKNLDTEENRGDRDIGDIGKSKRQDISPQITQMGEKPTTEARRHGEQRGEKSDH